MKCSDLQNSVSQYSDGSLDGPEVAIVKSHLAACPLCRERVDEYRAMMADMRQFGRAAIPAGVSNKVRLAVRYENRSRNFAGFNPARLEWLQMRLMPLSVGVMASLVIGFSFVTLLLSGRFATEDYYSMRGRDTRIMVAPDGNSNTGSRPDDISPVDFARTRMAVSGESPSINPQGALATISRSLVNHGIRNTEVVVVADVFSNGLARIAEVVEPSQNVNAVDELEKALDSDNAAAPFIPAELDNRSGSVRVVLKFQSVEVNTRKARKRH